MSAEVTQSDPLFEHMGVLHIESQPQLDPIVIRDEISQARTEGLAQAPRISARLARCSFGV